MKKIIAKPLTLEAFQPYGSFQDLKNVGRFLKGQAGDTEFYPDLLPLNLANTTLPSVCLSKVKKRKAIIKALEYHQYTCEGLVPLNGDCVMFVGPSRCGFDLERLEAFLIPQGTFVRINPGTIHGTQFPTQAEQVDILIILPERTYGNDMVKTVLPEEDQIEII